MTERRVVCAGGDSESLVLADIIYILRKAPRVGSANDRPEGDRYINISDTLVQTILERLSKLFPKNTADSDVNCHSPVYIALNCGEK